MKNKIKRIVCLSLVVVMLVASCIVVLAACKKKKYYDNETDKLVFASQDVDQVFNPFYSTSGTDSSVVGMTQIGMLTNDAAGKPAYGDNEAVVVKDLEITSQGTGENQTTTYKFVLKNNVRFSNGSYLTMKDVLFNLYVYLDPAYTGSSTIYSTDIVGLKEYRTQEANINEQDSFKAEFEFNANGRKQKLDTAISDINRDAVIGTINTSAQLRAKLVEYAAAHTGYNSIVADYDKAIELFRKELQEDMSSAKAEIPQDVVFKNDKGATVKPFTTAVEVFYNNEGLLNWNKKDNNGNGALTSALTNNVAELKNHTEEQAIENVFNRNIPSAFLEVINYWATAANWFEFMVNDEMEKFFQNDENIKFRNISGIKFANGGAARGGANSVTVNGVVYETPTYNTDGSVARGNEVLSITIKKIDPKAIWNFSFGVAPMYYYSDTAHINAFDYVSNFGVARGEQSWFDEVVKVRHIGVPVGAGPYAASKSSGGIENIKDSEFYNNNVIYFERNPHYIGGAPKIKSIRYQVVSSQQQINALTNNEIHFAEPNAKPDTKSQLDALKKDGFGNKEIQTSGYGYIGINAGKVPNIKVRQAIMHAINTMECIDYYQTTATPIYRSMSMSSWAYPQGCTSYYPYIGGKIPENLSKVNPDYKTFVQKKGKKAGETFTTEEQNEFILWLVRDLAGYTEGGDGIYQSGNDRLVYEFSIAGQETDHPAYNAMLHASEILNRNGFKITVRPRQDALKQLASGGLTVWAAAWGSTIDPDMYQVYHKDSTATSVLNWGYKQILLNNGGKYDYEYDLVVNKLSPQIDNARKTNNETSRAQIYSRCLDYVMQLAVELPTYQRNDLFAYNENFIDVNTFNKNTSSYKGLTSDIHTLSLVVKER